MSDFLLRLRGPVLASVVVLATVLTGCSGPSEPSSAAGTPGPTSSAYTVVTPATIRPGDPVPAPSGPVVLTVDGGGLEAPVRFDLASLESLGVVEYPTDDKQALGRTATFRGVLLQSVLDTVGARSATTLHTTAVNDYTVDIPASDARDYPVLVATSVDGERMSVETYGPLRVVYPTKGYTLDPTVYDPRWIWQLTDITVD